MSTLPKLDGVSEATLKDFLWCAAGNITIDDKNPLPKILDTEGRCVRVHVTGFRLNWHLLAERLLGACRPCEEFRVDGNFINARLKTSAQIDADGLACELDDKYPDALKTKIPTWWPFFDDVADEPRNARQIGQANGKQPAPRERRIPEGLATDIMKMMKTKCRLGTIDIDELVVYVKQAIPKKLDSEGKDRRARNIRIAIDKLVSTDFLFLHGDDQNQVSLSALIMEDEDDAEDSDA